MQAPITRTFAMVGVLVLTTGLARAQSVTTAAADVTRQSVKAIGYQVGSGATTVDLKPTALIPCSSGEARVEARQAVTNIEAKMKCVRPPTQLGAEFLTYVLWAVSPEGRAVNLSEVIPDKNGQVSLKATTQLQSFSLFVTAEPYAAVRQPSEMLILENDTRKNTRGRLFVVENFPLMKRSEYQRLNNPLALTPDLKNVPLEMYQARNAVEIARARGAEKYAPEIFTRAKGGLELAENALARKANKNQIISLAKQTTQFSEDARALAAERQEEERVANERAAAAAAARATAEAKAAAEAAAAKQRADEEARRQAELAAAREATLRAEAASREAQLKLEAANRETADREARIRAEAEAAAREAAIKADAERARATAEALRAQLLDQFNRILETRDTVRGLVITIADVLFDTGQYALRPNTRESLARLSGIILAHPGLRLEVEGHTDSTGSDELNQTLSERRAGAVREYLITQGLAAVSITAQGLGKTMPIADNTTAAGRQKNRRVEMIVSGEVIGVKIGR